MSKASKHPSAKAIEKMGYVTLDPVDALNLLGSKKLVDRVVGAVYAESNVKKQWVKETFSGENRTQFLESSAEPRVLAVCPGFAYAEAFFVDLDNAELDYLVTVEQEKRRPFGERPEEKRAREEAEERQRIARLPAKERAMISVQQMVENEGFDYTFRHCSNFAYVKDKKFHQLRQAYIKAAAALEAHVGTYE